MAGYETILEQMKRAGQPIPPAKKGPSVPNPPYYDSTPSAAEEEKARQEMDAFHASIPRTSLWEPNPSKDAPDFKPLGVGQNAVSSAMIPGSAEYEEQALQKPASTPVAPSSRAMPTTPTSATTESPTLTPVSPASLEEKPIDNWMGNTTVPTANVPDIANALPKDPDKLKQTAEKVALAMKQAKGTESEGFWRSIFQVVAGVADVAAKGLYGYGGREYTTQAERQLEQARQMAMLQAQQGFEAEQSALDRAQTTQNIKLTGEQNAAMQKATIEYNTKKDAADRLYQAEGQRLQAAYQNALTENDRERIQQEWKKIQNDYDIAMAQLNRALQAQFNLVPSNTLRVTGAQAGVAGK